MYILIEQFDYTGVSVSEELKTFLSNNKFKNKTTNKSPKLGVDIVGLYRDSSKNLDILALPKIFIDSTNQLFGIDVCEFAKSNTKWLDLEEKYKNFITKIIRLLFISFQKYKNQMDNANSEPQTLKKVIRSKNIQQWSDLDIAFNLFDFYKKNQNLVIFIQQQQRKNTNYKVNWNKTISNEQPLFVADSPIYGNFWQKTKQIDSKNELIEIYNQVLGEIKQRYHFPISNNQPTTIKLNVKFYQRATQKLNEFKSIHFEDRLKQLLLLLIAFCKAQYESKNNLENPQYIYTKNYHIIFENMVNKLLSDDNEITNKILKNQEDGKEIDHLYKDKDIWNDADIYYIADSKYYKTDTIFNNKDIGQYKQLTYALNCRQQFIKNPNIDETVSYKNGDSKGYNFIPNFFIRPYLEIDYLNIEQQNIKIKFEQCLNTESNHHFPNNFFDRNSLFLFVFKINYLFLLSSYCSKKDINSTRQELKWYIRQQIINAIEKKYSFLYLKDEKIIRELILKNFHYWVGKIYYLKNRDQIVIACKK